MDELKEFVQSLIDTSKLCDDFNLKVTVVINETEPSFYVDIGDGGYFTITIQTNKDSYPREFFSYRGFRCDAIDIYNISIIWAKYSGRIFNTIYEAGLTRSKKMIDDALDFELRIKKYKNDYGHLMIASTLSSLEEKLSERIEKVVQGIKDINSLCNTINYHYKITFNNEIESLTMEPISSSYNSIYLKESTATYAVLLVKDKTIECNIDNINILIKLWLKHHDEILASVYLIGIQRAEDKRLESEAQRNLLETLREKYADKIIASVLSPLGE